MKKILLILFVSMDLLSLPVRAQTDHAYLLNKYWYYRERLQYFVNTGIDGQSRGEGMVVSVRNKHSTDVISWENQMSQFGSYLGVLATEYALLNFYGQDASQPWQELTLALGCYERDDRCESRMPWYLDYDVFDGFHMDEDVPADFLTTHPAMNAGLMPANQVWNSEPGRPAWAGRVCANDYEQWDVEPGFTPYLTYQTITDMKEGAMDVRNSLGLIRGLVLVLKCLPVGSGPYTHAALILDKVITRMYSNGSWILLDPEMHAVEGGANATSYAMPLTVIRMAAGLGNLPPGPGTPTFNAAWQTLQYAPAGQENTNGTLSMAALCDCWNGGLSGMPGLNTTQAGLFALAGPEQWDTFYLLLWEFLHDKTSPMLDMNRVLSQLTEAPCEGPYCYDSLGHHHAPMGWAAPAKFDHPVSHQFHGQGQQQGNYNGLDYMLLYNLFHLVNLRSNIQPIAFMDMLNRNLSGTLPYCSYYPFDQLEVTWGDAARHADYDAFKTIKSTQVIDVVLHPRTGAGAASHSQCPGIGMADPGNATYRAGQCITLQPGFHALNGCYFHAYIDPFDCSESRDKQENPYAFINSGNEYELRGSIGNPWTPPASGGFPLASATPDPGTMSSGPLHVQLSPNPFTGELQLIVNAASDGQAQCRIFDVRGTQRWSQEVNYMAGQPLRMSLSGAGLEPGTYIFSIMNAEADQRITLIKH